MSLFCFLVCFFLSVKSKRANFFFISIFSDQPSSNVRQFSLDILYFFVTRIVLTYIYLLIHSNQSNILQLFNYISLRNVHNQQQQINMSKNTINSQYKSHNLYSISPISIITIQITNPNSSKYNRPPYTKDVHSSNPFFV